MIPVALAIPLLTALVTARANRLALLRMRAEMAATDAEKKAAIDDGLGAQDVLGKMIEKLHGTFNKWTDEDDKPAAVKP